MNPFYDAVPVLSNESLINKLYSAAITWDLETDDGKNPDDEKLFTTLTMHGLNDIWTKYVFSKENTNYSVQIHYFTESDYNNPNYTRELDDRFEDFMVNLQNTHYIGIITEIYNWVTGKNQ